MTFPRVSIVIPVMNGELYLGEAISSALNQDYPNFEVIVGINPSTDQTESVAERFKGDKRLVVYKFDKLVNMPENFNRSAHLSTGEYIKFLCHDDLLTQSALIDMVAAISLRSNCSLSAGYESFNPALRSIRDHRAFGVKNLVSRRRNFYRLIKYGNWIGGPSIALIRSSDFLSRGFDTKLECSFDYEYWIHLAKSGHLSISPNVVLISRVHEGQATSKCIRGGFEQDNKKILNNLRKDRNLNIFFRIILKISIR